LAVKYPFTAASPAPMAACLNSRHPRSRPRPGPATHPRLDHRHLVQRPHRAARQTVTTGLRPL